MSQMTQKIDWNSPILSRWLGTITRDGTKHVYKAAYKRYVEYTGMTAEQLIDEALEDQRKDPREKRDIVKQRLIGFYNWLVNEAPRRLQGRDKVVGKGLSSKISHTYVNAIRSLYGTFEVYVKLKGRSGLPKPRVKNKRRILSNADVKKLLDHCRSPRDRAIILIMFQSGMDVSTLCDLTYRHVARGLAENEHPLKLELYRQKSGTEYYTFLGRDACEAIKAYLNDLKARGIQLGYNDPLFLKEGPKAFKKEPLTPWHVQRLMRDLAVKAGFVDENMNGKAINPLSPHALRESFSSIMTNKGVPDTIVDFWLGHEIGEMAEAYKRGQQEELKRLYLEREEYLSVTSPSERNLEQKIEAEVEKRTRWLVNENIQLKQNLQQLQRRIDRFEAFVKKFMTATAEELEDIAEEVFKRKRKTLEQILTEHGVEIQKHQEAVAEDEKIADEVQHGLSL